MDFKFPHLLVEDLEVIESAIASARQGMAIEVIAMQVPLTGAAKFVIDSHLEKLKRLQMSFQECIYANKQMKTRYENKG